MGLSENEPVNIVFGKLSVWGIHTNSLTHTHIYSYGPPHLYFIHNANKKTKTFVRARILCFLELVVQIGVRFKFEHPSMIFGTKKFRMKTQWKAILRYLWKLENKKFHAWIVSMARNRINACVSVFARRSAACPLFPSTFLCLQFASSKSKSNGISIYF